MTFLEGNRLLGQNFGLNMKHSVLRPGAQTLSIKYPAKVIADAKVYDE
jgi:hypothetical protein